MASASVLAMTRQRVLWIVVAFLALVVAVEAYAIVSHFLTVLNAPGGILSYAAVLLSLPGRPTTRPMPRGYYPHLKHRGPKGPKPGRPCVACGLAPGNDLWPVLNLSAAARGHGGVRILWLSMSLCTRCLLEAARDGRVTNPEGLRDSLAGLRAMAGHKPPVSVTP